MMKMTYRDIKTFPCVRVVLQDHVKGATETQPVEAFGRLISNDGDTLILAHWVPMVNDSEYLQENWEVMSIVVGAVKAIYELKEDRLP